MRQTRNLPHCHSDGHVVCVTLDLDPSEVRGGFSYVVWGVGDMVTRVSKVEGLSATCSLPEGVFIEGDLLKLEVLPGPETEQLVFPWTQITVIKEGLFEARMLRGEPVLVPVERQQPTGGHKSAAGTHRAEQTGAAAMAASCW